MNEEERMEEARKRGESLVELFSNFDELAEEIESDLDAGLDWKGLSRGVKHALFERNIHELYEMKALIRFAKKLKNRCFDEKNWNLLQFFWWGPTPRNIVAHELTDKDMNLKLFLRESGGRYIEGDDGDIEILSQDKIYRCRWLWKYDESFDESCGETESPGEVAKREKIDVEAIIVYYYDDDGNWLEIYLK